MKISLSTNPNRGCIKVIGLSAIFLWVFVFTLGHTIFGMVLSSFPVYFPLWILQILPISNFFFIAVLLIPIIFIFSDSRYKSTFQTWLLAGLFVLLLSPLQFLPKNAYLIRSLLRITLLIAYCSLLIYYHFRRHSSKIIFDLKNSSINTKLILLAVTFSSVCAYPWLMWGALGSLVNTFLNVITAFLFGLSVVLLLEIFSSESIEMMGKSISSDLFVSGWVMGVTIMIMAGGMGFEYHAVQLLLIISLPSLGWLLVKIYDNSKVIINSSIIEVSFTPVSSLIPSVLLVGLASMYPLMLIDPDELNLLISLVPGETLFWALKSAIFSFLIVTTVAIIILINNVYTRKKRQETQSEGILLRLGNWISGTILSEFVNKHFNLHLCATLSFLLGAALYSFFGQPGFYNDTIFVVLNDQKTISFNPNTSYTQRKILVYQSLVQHALQSQSNIRNTLDRLSIEYTPYYLVNALEVKGGPIIRLWFYLHPDVDRILENPWLRPLPAPPPVDSGDETIPDEPPWNLSIINSDRVWNEMNITGKGIVIGHSDSGVQWDHPDLVDSYRGWDDETRSPDHTNNWLDPWYKSEVPMDYIGHGTHTLGSILGNRTGVAPDSEWFACVNLARNMGNPALYVDCLQYMLAPYPPGGNPFEDGDPSSGAHIINNSWGCPQFEGCDADVLQPAFRSLHSAGIFIVASSGNDGPFCETINSPPSIYPQVFSVGSIDQNKNLSLFSSLGPVSIDGRNLVKPDVVAPGEGILSTLPNDSYGLSSGTSMAGPHVAGVVALIWSANPHLIGDNAKTADILTKSTTHYQGSLPDCSGASEIPSTAVGYGIIDAYQAVQMAFNNKSLK